MHASEKQREKERERERETKQKRRNSNGYFSRNKCDSGSIRIVLCDWASVALRYFFSAVSPQCLGFNSLTAKAILEISHRKRRNIAAKQHIFDSTGALSFYLVLPLANIRTIGKHIFIVDLLK